VPGEERVPFDLAGYIDRVRSAPCFICRIVSGVHDRETHIVHRDQRHIVFLPTFHVLRGYALVAPTEHREAVAADFTEGDTSTFNGLFVASRSPSSGRLPPSASTS
jgi:hypothetical protein